MIAEICMRHAKICITQLHYKTTLLNSVKNQRLIPFIIRVKLSLVKRAMFELFVRISRFVNYNIVTDYSLILWGSNGRLNVFFSKQLLLDIRLSFSSTAHESASLIQFTSLKLSQPASSLFFLTQNAKEPTRELQNSTGDSILEIFEDRVSSWVLRLVSDCQLTFAQCCKCWNTVL